MKFQYDPHGDKHFGHAGGGGRGTCWANSKDKVLPAIQSYLEGKHAALDHLRQTRGSGSSVDFYIVDDMSALTIAGGVPESRLEFTIQGTYTTTEFSGSTVVFHMYPDNTGVSRFGIGITKNDAIDYSRGR